MHLAKIQITLLNSATQLFRQLVYVFSPFALRCLNPPYLYFRFTYLKVVICFSSNPSDLKLIRHAIQLYDVLGLASDCC